jgi:serine/threonine protein kinase
MDVAENLLAAFQARYREKYTLSSQTLIGSGAYANVYKANDNFRGLDVAVKIYHDGISPEGAERGWNITTRIVHNQISPTYTIEEFQDTDDTVYKAAISRYIPGVSLKSVFDFWSKQDEKSRILMTDDFVYTFIPKLLEVLEVCHSNNFGHGDLHSGNIIVVLTEIEERYSFTPVLIDFDNSSLPGEKFIATEKEKIEKDCRSLVNSVIGVLPNILYEWPWYSELESFLRDYTTVSDLRIAFRYLLKFTDLYKKSSLTDLDIEKILLDTATHIFSGFKPYRLNQTLRSISEKEGFLDRFIKIHEKVQQIIANGPTISTEITEIRHGSLKSELYKRLFNHI